MEERDQFWEKQIHDMEKQHSSAIQTLVCIGSNRQLKEREENNWSEKERERKGTIEGSSGCHISQSDLCIQIHLYLRKIDIRYTLHQQLIFKMAQHIE